MSPDPAFEFSPFEEWLSVEKTSDPYVFQLSFEEHHLGNPVIRSIHGGVVGALIEYVAKAGLNFRLQQMDRQADVDLTSTSLEYLRVTKDAPVYAKCEIIRVARRIGFVDVWCWQDSEELMVTRGVCTLRISNH